MKSAFLLSKTDTLFDSFASYLKSNYEHAGGKEPTFRSVCVNPNGGFRFMFYDRPEERDSFETYEIPEEALRAGYIFGYMIECRSETLFCEVVGATPSEIDILVCDTDGNLFKPSELDPATIVL